MLEESFEPVDRDAFERRLDAVRSAVTDPAAGVFGPASMTWRVDREAALFLGAGRALLLQLAHPWVAAAIADHSRALDDPLGRFHRTFGIVFAMVFGTLDDALGAARRLHQRHAAIEGVLSSAAGPFASGSAYRANEVSALRWVHATLVETSLLAHDLVLPPLSPAERDRYYAESHTLAALFGIPRAALPATWRDFVTYNAAMQRSGNLTVTPAARSIAERVLAGGGKAWLRAPVWYRTLTAEMLPERLRQGYGLEFGEREREASSRAVAQLRRLYPRLPKQLRFVGPYLEAQGRMAGKPSPGAATQLANLFWIGRRRLGEQSPRR